MSQFNPARDSTQSASFKHCAKWKHGLLGFYALASLGGCSEPAKIALPCLTYC